MSLRIKLTYIILFLSLGMIAGRLPAVFRETSQKELWKEDEILKKLPSAWTIHRERGFMVETDRIKRMELERLVSDLQKGNIPDDWEETIERIAFLSTDFFEKDNAFRILFLKWSELDFETAMDRAAMMGRHARGLKKEIYSRLAAVNPQKALSYFENNKGTLFDPAFYHGYALREVAKNWALRSPAEALAWCNSLEGTLHYEHCIREYLLSVEIHNPGELKKYIDRVYSEKGSVPQSVLYEWAKISPKEARDWLSEEGKDNYHNKQSIITGIANADLALAEEMISNLSTENEKFGSVWNITRTMENMVGPEEAFTWQMKMLPDFTPNISLWVRAKPYEARKWIESLPATKGRDEAIATYAENVPSIDLYPDALKFTESSINDPYIRKSAMQNVIRNWTEKTPEGFQQWIAGPECPDALRNNLEELTRKEE